MSSPGELPAALRSGAREALACYDLDVAAVDLLARGRDTVLCVRDERGGRYVLRLHDPEHASEAGLRARLDWLEALSAESDLVVPRPVALRSGEPAGEIVIDGSSWRFHLLEWVEGERAPDARSFIEPARLEAVGSVVARLHDHAASRSALPTTGLRELDGEALVGARSAIARDELARLASPEAIRALRSAAASLQARLDSLPRSAETFGIIHADLEPQNWVFREGRPRPIDFGECAVGYFAFDLLGVLWTHCHWDGYESYREALLRGYESRRPLGPELRASLDHLQAATLFHWLNFIVLAPDPKVREELGAYVPVTIERIRGFVGRGVGR